MPFGYTGNILHVDLTKEKLWVENPPESFYRQYIGGSAMGTYYVLKGTPAHVDPLGPENVLTLFDSVVTGVAVPGQSRMSANAKSPLTGTIGDGQAGGFFPAELKFAGFDGIVVTGKASHPVYLWLHDGKAELRDARHLWGGKTTTEVDAAIKAELHDDKVQVAQCGPAGEKLVPLACIMNMANRANGRTGLGAVMGSKNLKAVAVRGTGKATPAHPERVQALAKWGAQELGNNAVAQLLKNYGTAGVIGGQNAGGTFPAYNYNEGQFANWENLCGETMSATILHGTDTCFACGVRCKREIDSEWAGHKILSRSGGPEYESISTLGSYCGIDDLKLVSYANQLCNEYGLDTIGTGATISWAMECFEHGAIKAEEVGFPVRWGDPNALLRLLDMIVKRQGFGDVLCQGSAKAAKLLGRGAEYLITVKGAEAPAHMPQAKRTLALIYATQPFGADHQSHSHDPSIEHGSSPLEMQHAGELGFDHTLPPRSLGPEKVAYAMATQHIYSFDDVAGLCQFVWGGAWQLYGPEQIAELVRATTGWDDFSLAEVRQVGERRLNLMRVFNAREGFTRADDKLPPKFFQPMTGTGPTAGVALDPVEIERTIDCYYEMAGWDKFTGAPTRERLAALGISWAADYLPAGR